LRLIPFLPIVRFVQKARRAAPVAFVLAVEAAGVVLALRAGSRPPFDVPLDDWDAWARAEPIDALASAVRVVALATASWLLATTLAYLVASVSRLPRVVRTCALLTPSGVRRAVDAVCAASVLVGALAAPVAADVRDGRAVETRPVETRPVETPAPVYAAAPASAPPPPTTAPRAEVEVLAGDNLWVIAADALARATGRARDAITDDEVAPYWRALCDLNRDRVRSGDVNLVYPGEVLLLPPVS
jgi:hypothetical protein